LSLRRVKTDPKEVEVMLSDLFRSVVFGSWITSLAVIAVVSIAMDANVSTTALLVALDVAPALVAVLIAGGVPSPTVAELLHSVEANGSR
jgi:hypothetical protein